MELIDIGDGHFVEPESGRVLSELGHRSKSNGYVRVWLSGKTISVHRLIWETVHGPIPAGMTINHRDGNKANNRISNLELCTLGENIAHAYRTGLRARNGGAVGRRGAEHHAARLTQEQVDELRTTQEPIAVVAQRFGITPNHASDIRGGRSWK